MLVPRATKLLTNYTLPSLEIDRGGLAAAAAAALAFVFLVKGLNFKRLYKGLLRGYKGLYLERLLRGYKGLLRVYFIRAIKRPIFSRPRQLPPWPLKGLHSKRILRGSFFYY